MPENFARFESLFKDFAAYQGQTIKSAKKLAEMMAHKAALMRDVFFKVVKSKEPSTLKDQLTAFKEVLMHDMDEAQFADVYAQTVAYGLFTARLHDKSLHDFNRGEALTLIPKTNPFLQKLFQYVAGADIDNRVVWIVDALCEVYRAADLKVILKDFGSTTGRRDPILHFYETFLAEYDPKLREVRGVYYTPEPVVQFIVRAVDDVLKDHFGLKDGLADTSKVKIKVDSDRVKRGKRQKDEISVHKVQLLDIATGTGTFPAEIMKQIYARFKGQEGLWGSYVEKDLLPRMHGFELLVASYAMCHMKLDMVLKETGYDSSKSSKRLNVYLTNSLEEYHKDSHLPFANWLSTEANEASRIKRDMPIMIALGNPPYSGHSANKGKWIQNLLDVYKKEPGGKVRLQERMYKWLQDDYVKFIRLGEYYIEKNGEGVLAYITNHGYLDNPTFRGMRWHLMNTFDDIYILDLHGSTKKMEVAPAGKADKNVFDIQQGVSIIIAIKKSRELKKKGLAVVRHVGVWGTRQEKYSILEKGSIKDKTLKRIEPCEPFYFFVPKNYNGQEAYNEGFSLPEIFSPYGNPAPGMVSTHDEFAISRSKEEAISKVEKFLATETEQEARTLFKLCSQDQWMYSKAKKELPLSGWQEQIVPVAYRPFDNRFTVYDRNVAVHRRERASKHFLSMENIGLVTCRQIAANEWRHSYVSQLLVDDSYISNKSKERGYFFPLYIDENDMLSVGSKKPNLNPKIYAAIKKIVPKVTPESLFDYIYAVLHSPEYRKRYVEFLKSDFPRIPYPKNAQSFDELAKLGGEIRALHLLESKKLDRLVTTYPVGGDHEVIKPRWEDTDKKAVLGKVWINPVQYFDHVPKNAWEFYIGGYQPAQKWLKDRKGRALTPDDIRHWQKIIIALSETDRLMQEIDKIKFLPKGKS